MKFAVAVAALASGAAAWSNVTYVTDTVTAVTTYCPSATVISHGSSTVTVTAPTTVTFTNCPCTITRPVTTTSTTYANSTTAAPTKSTTTTTPVGTISSTVTTSPPAVTAGAGKAISGAGLAGALGLAAFFL